MTAPKAHSLRTQLAFAATALLALGGAVGAGHAQTADSVATASSAALTSNPSLPVFTPSAEPAFDQAFDHLDGAAADPVLPPHAVDITAIDPAVEGEAQSLGRGVASYYGRRFAGRPTASGEAFDPQDLTAAHRSLPFGSRVRVTNPHNGRSVVVRINDRGPFVAGRLIDVSRIAAEQLGMIQSGHATVELELLNG
ncbi:hypothetical protein GCM10009127_16440 [Alteraurantiacibacter aestuarii]|uniref:Endolytic peptidoglycan transglycosylase RlpA n=1 Tax=Alteraurantiacibacter aestuarii TaxID=650004 RepID=A0A844ZL87_9SPHN|nr:septal ring lytic transglycosylase RlpA family protein [Alteraurantiacibacter aestuarii]MXO87770.1 septal ring lytic transglycosylase RlpA family protein [Alteraurantiacibacter aestuarii]